jgi:hypothetical protein
MFNHNLTRQTCEKLAELKPDSLYVRGMAWWQKVFRDSFNNADTLSEDLTTARVRQLIQSTDNKNVARTFRYITRDPDPDPPKPAINKSKRKSKV